MKRGRWYNVQDWREDLGNEEQDDWEYNEGVKS